MDELAAEARRLRRDEGLSGRQIRERLGVPKQRLQDWLRGVPPPEWTRRPNAKDDLRVRAVALRGEGSSVNDIALEIGVARSTAWQWVRHLPLDRDSERAHRKRQHAKLMTDAQWATWRQCRDERRDAARRRAAESVKPLTETDLLCLGALMYWCEGTKSKPWRSGSERLVFTNSDPGLVTVHLRFLGSLGVTRDRMRFRVAIHETADAGEAVRWWADVMSADPESFLRTTVKRHATSTNRRNIGAGYHGCLVITVLRSRELYWQIEGIVAAIVAGCGRAVVPAAGRRPVR